MKRKQQHTNPSIPPYTWLLSRWPNFMASLTHPLRSTAVAHLELQVGDRVLDAGCGTGMSFPYLVNAVGESGEVVGVEISQEVAHHASKRVQRHGWKNVHVLVEAAQTVHLNGRFDGLLLLGAHEIFTSAQALDHLLAYLQKDARLVAFGAKYSRGPLAGVFNPLLGALTRRLLSQESAPIDEHPWRLLEERVEALQIEERVPGFLYLAWGSLRSTVASHESR